MDHVSDQAHVLETGTASMEGRVPAVYLKVAI